MSTAPVTPQLKQETTPAPAATTAPAFKERKSTLEPVKEDGVLKELVRNEKKALSSWDQKWGFMRNPRVLWEQEAIKRGLTVEVFDKKVHEPWTEMRRPTMPAPPCDPLPLLASAMVGWRSSKSENCLDWIAGPMFVSPIRTIDPPRTENQPDPKNQRFIYLG